jgi:hypothetical protein
MLKKSISLYTYFLLIFIFIFANLNIKKWQNNEVINWDIIGYYAYLPSTFIYHDYKLNFLKTNPPTDPKVKFWPLTAPNGNFVNKFSMGMSVMYAPFFFLAHLQTQAVGAKPNGFSWHYQKYVHLSCLFYLFIGLFFLRKLLLKWFDEWAVALTLISVTLGTNLFYNATTEAAMSHAYNFSLAAVFMYCVHSWFDNNHIKYAIGIGLTLGLLVLIRPINIVFGLFPLLYGISAYKDILKNINHFLARPIHLAIVLTCSFLVVLPQLLYWKSVTGQFLFFSYVGERFFFLRPMIFHGLFSFRNGWLIYTPIMIFSLIGLYQLFKQKFQLSFAILSILALYIYLVFSWWCWWYVGFGNRAMIDLYSLLAIPMASFYTYALKQIDFKKWTMITICFLLIGLNLFQTLQYRLNLVHFDSMTFKAYLASFGKLHFTDEYKSALKQPDYEKAKQGITD